MNNAAVLETEQPESSRVIDISANLLLTWVEDSKELATRQSSQSFKKIFGIIFWVFIVGGLATFDQMERSSVEGLRSDSTKLSKKLKTLGISSKPDKQASSDISAIQTLSTAYGESNSDLIRVLGFTLSETKGQMALKTARIESSPTGIKITGGASALDVRTMRVYLDAVQTAIPGAEGLMTSINSTSSELEKGLQISFEITKPATYNFTPAPKAEKLGTGGATSSSDSSGSSMGTAKGTQ